MIRILSWIFIFCLVALLATRAHAEFACEGLFVSIEKNISHELERHMLSPQERLQSPKALTYHEAVLYPEKLLESAQTKIRMAKHILVDAGVHFYEESFKVVPSDYFGPKTSHHEFWTKRLVITGGRTSLLNRVARAREAQGFEVSYIPFLVNYVGTDPIVRRGNENLFILNDNMIREFTSRDPSYLHASQHMTDQPNTLEMEVIKSYEHFPDNLNYSPHEISIDEIKALSRENKVLIQNLQGTKRDVYNAAHKLVAHNLKITALASRMLKILSEMKSEMRAFNFPFRDLKDHYIYSCLINNIWIHVKMTAPDQNLSEALDEQIRFLKLKKAQSEINIYIASNDIIPEIQLEDAGYPQYSNPNQFTAIAPTRSALPVRFAQLRKTLLYLSGKIAPDRDIFFEDLFDLYKKRVSEYLVDFPAL